LATEPGEAAEVGRLRCLKSGPEAVIAGFQSILLKFHTPF